jgi:hypothetical protein
LKLLIELTIC